jgi:hypothetical protein
MRHTLIGVAGILGVMTGGACGRSVGNEPNTPTRDPEGSAATTPLALVGVRVVPMTFDVMLIDMHVHLSSADLAPGESVHDELREMVAAGLTPFDALRAGTTSAAEFLGRPDLGRVAVGARARTCCCWRVIRWRTSRTRVASTG